MASTELNRFVDELQQTELMTEISNILREIFALEDRWWRNEYLEDREVERIARRLDKVEVALKAKSNPPPAVKNQQFIYASERTCEYFPVALNKIHTLCRVN